MSDLPVVDRPPGRTPLAVSYHQQSGGRGSTRLMRRLGRCMVYAVGRTVSHMAFEVRIGRMCNALAGQASLVGRNIAPKRYGPGGCGSRRRCSGVLTNGLQRHDLELHHCCVEAFTDVADRGPRHVKIDSAWQESTSCRSAQPNNPKRFSRDTSL